MKNTFKIICLLIVSIATAQENIHNKNKNTLVEFSEITEYYNKVNSSQDIKADINAYAGTYGYLTIVESLESVRKIDSNKLMWLTSILKSLSIAENAKEIFESEVLLNTNGEKYWLPIQNELLDYWNNEMKLKKKALIYIRAFGSTKDIEENKWLFTINSFNSNFYDGLWEEALDSFNQQNEKNGLRCINKLIELNPKDGRNFSMYGYYYYDKGYPDNVKLLRKADSLYSIAEKLSPNYSYGYYQKALVKFQLGEYSKAWDNIEKARNLGETRIEKVILERFENKLPYAEYLEGNN